MDFQDRLKQAVMRGQGAQQQRAAARAAQRLSEEDLKSLHAQWQIDLCERMESRLRCMADEMLGFRFRTIMDEQGWGAAVYRDDVALADGKSENQYSRLELVVRRFAPHHVLELVGKATIKNREFFHRNYYQRLEEVDVDTFFELVDRWALEFAEQYTRVSK